MKLSRRVAYLALISIVISPRESHESHPPSAYPTSNGRFIRIQRHPNVAEFDSYSYVLDCSMHCFNRYLAACKAFVLACNDYAPPGFLTCSCVIWPATSTLYSHSGTIEYFYGRAEHFDVIPGVKWSDTNSSGLPVWEVYQHQQIVNPTFVDNTTRDGCLQWCVAATPCAAVHFAWDHECWAQLDASKVDQFQGVGDDVWLFILVGRWGG